MVIFFQALASPCRGAFEPVTTTRFGEAISEGTEEFGDYLGAQREREKSRWVAGALYVIGRVPAGRILENRTAGAKSLILVLSHQRSEKSG
jgi:hypothetical protein